MNLAEVTAGLRDRIARNGGIPGKNVIFDFGDDGLVRIDGSTDPAGVSNDDGESDCRVKLALADFLDIVAGTQNPQMAFMTGKLRIEGDMGIAMQLGALLG